MDQDQLSRFRDRLLAMRASLDATAETSQEATRTVMLDQASVGRLSRMDALQAQQMAHEAARRRELQLAKISGALRRIDAGDFGYCHACGEEIDPRRLEADPTTTRCLGCVDA